MSTGPFSYIRSAVRSEVGLKRRNNEDSHGEFPGHGIWCVADGMGGGDDGEIASAAVVQEIGRFCKTYLAADAAYDGADVAEGICAAVNRASRWIFQRAEKKSLKGCGSTFVGVVFDAGSPGEAVALHAGDSRLYRLRGREIRQITKDHSAAELIGAKDEADLNPMFRGMILRAVGVRPAVDIDKTPLQVREGDTLLICSDGLSKMVPDPQVSAIVRKNGDDLDAAAAALVAATYEAGAVDNVTFQLLRVGRLPAPCATVPLPKTAMDPSSAPGGEDAQTGETFVGTASGSTLLETVGGTVEGRTAATDVFTEAEEGPELNSAVVEPPPKSPRWRRPALMAAGGVVLAGLLAWYVSYSIRKTRRPPVVVTPSGLASEMAGPAETNVVESKAAEKAPVAALPVEAGAQAPAPSVKSREECERDVLLERLRAERQKMRQAEIRAMREDVAFTRAVGELIQACRGSAFDEFAARVDAAVGRSSGDRLRLLGKRLSTMKPDDDKVGSAASDFVAEMQKIAAAGKGGAAVRGLSGLAGLDSTSAAAFAACARAITPASATRRKDF